MEEMLEKILNIEPCNEFLQYIVERVQRDDYRGIQISQHNRYDMDIVIAILKNVYDVVQDDFLPVPLGDISTDVIRESAEGTHPEFAVVVEKINSEIGRTTENSLKKNFFVDFSRAGFIDRFGKDKKMLDPNNRSHVHFVKLTEDAIALIQEETIVGQYYIFSRKIDTLFGDAISDLAEMIYHSTYSNDSISYTEFQYILSDTRKTAEEKIYLLSSYRDLNELQKKNVHRMLKDYCNPDNFDGSKTVKRDFHNWRNETQQIMQLLKNTIYFDVREKNFALNRGKFGIFPEISRQQRRLSVKQEYFSNHKVIKRDGFDLHHVVPIKFVRNKEEFILIDNYKNLIYMERSVHKNIKDYHIVLHVDSGIVKFEDIYSNSNPIEATNNLSVMYNEDLSSIMVSHNKDILRERFEWRQ